MLGVSYYFHTVGVRTVREHGISEVAFKSKVMRQKLFDLGAWIENDAGLPKNGENCLARFRKRAKG